MYIHQNIGHASHKKLQDMADLESFQGLTKHIPQLTVPLPICMIYKFIWLVRQPTVINEDVYICTIIQDDFTLFDVTYIIIFALAFNVINSTSSYTFGLPTR